jgi:hypothetical protein
VSLCCFRVAEDCVWDPYQAHHVAVQSKNFHCAVESKATVCPGLSKKYINLVFLKQSKKQKKDNGILLVNFLWNLIVFFIKENLPF